MIKVCNVCGLEKEHKSWKSTTCNDCLDACIKFCSACKTVQPIENYQLCRGKPIGRCRTCENKRSYQGKVESCYLDRPEIRAKRNEESRLNKQRVAQDPDRQLAIYDRHNERQRERRATDPEYRQKVLNDANARRAIRQNAGKYSADEWERAKRYFNHECAYCGKKAELHQEHVIPLSKGGRNTADNIIPSCLHCNSSKYNKEMQEWYSARKYFSNERLAKILAFIGGDAKCHI